MLGGHPVQQVGGGHVAHHRAVPAPVLQEVVVEQDEDLVGVEEGAGVVNDPQAVGVAVGGDTQGRAALQDLLGQGEGGGARRAGQASAEEGVAALVDGVHVAARRHEDRLEAGARDPEHGVQDDLEVRVADRLQVHRVQDGVDVPVHGGLGGDGPLRQGGPALQAPDVGGVEGVGVLLERGGDLHLGVTAPGGEDLQAVVGGGVVGGGHGHAVGAAQVTDRPHDHGCGGGAVDDVGADAVAGQHLRGPPGELRGEEPLVVPDDDGPVRHALGVDTVRQGLGHALDVEAGEAVGDDGAPAAGSETDGDNVSSRSHVRHTSQILCSRGGLHATSDPQTVRQVTANSIHLITPDRKLPSPLSTCHSGCQLARTPLT